VFYKPAELEPELASSVGLILKNLEQLLNQFHTKLAGSIGSIMNWFGRDRVKDLPCKVRKKL
jgi:hypothetical protein